MLAVLGTLGAKRAETLISRAGAGVGPPEDPEAAEGPEAPRPGTYFFCRLELAYRFKAIQLVGISLGDQTSS